LEILIIGLVIFLSSHLIPSFYTARKKIVTRIGIKNYSVAFNIVSVVSVALIIYGFKTTNDFFLYTPPAWGQTVTAVLMLPAIYLFLSNSVRSAPSSAQAITANPLSWGVVLWSFGHLIANGEVSSVLLFATFLLLGLTSILTSKRRGAKPRQERRPPFSQELIFLLIVGIVYSVLIWGHYYITGAQLI